MLSMFRRDVRPVRSMLFVIEHFGADEDLTVRIEQGGDGLERFQGIGKMFENLDHGDQINGMRGNLIQLLGDEAGTIQRRGVSVIPVGMKTEIAQQSNEQAASGAKIENGSGFGNEPCMAHGPDVECAGNAPLDRSGIGMETERAVAFLKPEYPGDLQRTAGVAEFVRCLVLPQYGLREMLAEASSRAEKADFQVAIEATILRNRHMLYRALPCVGGRVRSNSLSYTAERAGISRRQMEKMLPRVKPWQP